MLQALAAEERRRRLVRAGGLRVARPVARYAGHGRHDQAQGNRPEGDTVRPAGQARASRGLAALTRRCPGSAIAARHVLRPRATGHDDGAGVALSGPRAPTLMADLFEEATAEFDEVPCL